MAEEKLSILLLIVLSILSLEAVDDEILSTYP
jgi:hypothetical protein